MHSAPKRYPAAPCGGLQGCPIVSQVTAVPTRKRRRPKPPPDPRKPLRRSVWLLPEHVRDIQAQARLEERKFSDMVRILIQRGLRVTRGAPPTPTTEEG